MVSRKFDEPPPMSKREKANQWAGLLLVICLMTGAAGFFALLKQAPATGFLFTISGLSLVGSMIAIGAKESLTERRTDDRAALDTEKGYLEIEKLRLEIERLRRELDEKPEPARRRVKRPS